MECYSQTSYREVSPDLQTQDSWNEITLNAGGTQSTLQDIKVAEKSGGYCYKHTSKSLTQNRFIYWRSYHDILELSEISLDINLYNNNVRYKFPDSPVLSVTIIDQNEFITILVTTVSSIHRLNYRHPEILCKHNSTETKSLSIFCNPSMQAKDLSTYYVISQSTSQNNTIPHTASSYLTYSGQEAFFGLAYQTHILLFCMNCETNETICHSLKENNIVPKILSNFKGALVRGNISADSEYPTSIIFNHVGKQTFLIALYRDDHIRMWSTSTFQCVYKLSCLQYRTELRSQGAQFNSLRKINETNICAFLYHSMGSEFVIIKIDWDNMTNYSMSRTKRVVAPQSNLADFEVSDNKIWALWCNAQGEFIISNFSLVPEYENRSSWMSVAMEPQPDRYNILVDQGVDPRQAYCSYIFHPGKFSKDVIVKALSMYYRCSNNIYDVNLPMNVLKDRVCQAVEAEVQNEIKDFEITDDEYVDICTRLWEKFYSCCEQYHLKASQPIGIVLLNSFNAICVVKKSFFTLLRPCEILEHLLISDENIGLKNFVITQFDVNQKCGEDLSNLFAILSQMERQISDEVKMDIDRKLYQLEMPDTIISEILYGMSSLERNKEIFPREFFIFIRQKLQSMSDIRTAMGILLNSLRLNLKSPERIHNLTNLVNSSQNFLNSNNLLGSNIGISVLSESIRQIVHIRYTLCRNLLILQQLLINTFVLGTSNVLETIRSQFMPETVVFVQSYYVMVWISETPVYIHQMVSLNNDTQKLHLLSLTDDRPVFSGQNQCVPVLRAFLHSKGLYTSLLLLVKKFELSNLNWEFTLLPIANIVTQLIWSISGNFTFGQWLFGSCFHNVIQQYVRLLSSWCEWNNCSRQFILAVSLLSNGEPNKAYDLFLQSIKGIFNEPFLNEIIMKSYKNLKNDELTAQYYLKVIQLFEQHNNLDYIILVAQAAIGILKKNDPQLPMFQSIIFNNHLMLEHFEEAYHSLIYNADFSRRKDCLRQLIICLFNKKRLDLLMHFPYNSLQDEFENIVESRARSVLVEHNELYDFLYAFYVSKDNMRKASSVMYEVAMRLHIESNSIESIQKRYDCLLACINCLNLIDVKFQWIAKPIVNEDNISINSSSNGMDTEDYVMKEHIAVIEISDVKKELLQTEAFLYLARHRRDINSFLSVGPEELIIILSNNCLFTLALKLSAGFNLKLTPIFESLTAACIRAIDENPNDVLTWLQGNDLADLLYKNNPSEIAWQLLKNLIKEYEEPNSTTIRKSVLNKILMLNAFPPQWLCTTYKLLNASELLRIFIKHDRFIEAANLADEYIWAMLGRGKEYFGFSSSLHSTTPEMCLPINSIDILLNVLRSNSKDVENRVEYKQVINRLEETIQIYIKTAKSVSKEMVAYQCQGNQ